jgi:type I restriction enzyme S subunit
MVSEWRRVQLAKLCRFQAGTVFPKDFQGEQVGDYPFIKVSDMNLPGNERKILFASNWVSEKTRETLRAKSHPAGATVFAKIGVALTYNRRRLLERLTIIDNNMMSAIPDDSIVYSRFFYYLLLTIDFNEIAAGTALPYINIGDLEKLSILLPPLPKQRAIAHILGTLDDKIELNHRMNQTLEAMAQALFKSWFVDFEPFRDQGMQDSPLGEIPVGWRIGRVNDIAMLHRESISPSGSPNEIFNHYSIPAFDEGQMPKAETGDQIRSNKFQISYEAVLISKLNPRFPRVWLPCDSGSGRSVCSTEFLVVTPKNNMGREYLYSLFSLDSFLAIFSTLVTGTSSSHQRVRPEDLMAIDVVIPPERVTTSFSHRVRPLLTLVNHNLAQNGTLSSIRDTLLPKLLSGEIRVKDAEKFVERAT